MIGYTLSSQTKHSLPHRFYNCRTRGRKMRGA